jgi:multiple sugar transport system substrate-binding protein
LLFYIQFLYSNEVNMKKERQYLLENALLNQFKQGRMSRRKFMQSMIVGGLGMAGVNSLASALPAFAQDSRPLTPTFYQWIVDLHPSIPAINEEFGDDLNMQIAPVQGFDVARFIAEASNQESTWDVYVGMTPFVEMASLIQSGAIEPWDDYIPQDVLDDLLPSIREECTIDGKLYSWPFLLDVIVQGYNSSITNAAGLPDTPPANWTEYLANSQAVLDSGAARYGCTFDSNGWRSLAPITHSFSTDVYYTLEGDDTPLFDFTNEAAVEALMVMKQMLDLSSANALQPGTTDGGVNNTPDEVAFGAQQVAYYVKYQNAPLRFAATWPDPSALRMGALPTAEGGAGATVFWTTGACLFKYGQNKERAAEYLTALTRDQRIWQDSIAGSATAHPGQLPPYASIYAGWEEETPEWLEAQSWVPLVRGQLDAAKAIPNHAFGLQQFVLGKQYWERYLTGEEPDPVVALQAAKDAVVAEIQKTT